MLPGVAEIFDLFETCLSSGSVLRCLVEGEPGSGKSSFVWQLRARAEASPSFIYVHVVNCKTLIGETRLELSSWPVLFFQTCLTDVMLIFVVFLP